MRNPTLPEEILLEIFARIPAKSVGRCRCLSKLWLTNLSTSQFINLHLNRHQEENLLLIANAGSLHTIALPSKDDNVSTELSGLPGNWKRVLGSCNGLVLLMMMNDKNELFLVNPITQQQVRVPDTPLPCDTNQKCSVKKEMYGFGYDIYKDDYKILTLTTYRQIRSHYTFAHVYSLKMGVWRRVPCDFRYVSRGITAGAHVNGVIHWLTIKRVQDDPYMLDSELGTFNLADEEFGVVPLPAHNCRARFRASVLRGCLILVTEIELDVVVVWIMKKYGVQESWTNFSICLRALGQIKYEPLCFIGENEVVMLCGGSLLFSNLETQESKTIVVDGAHSSFLDGSVFVESLVSPSSLTLVAEEKNDGTDIANNTLALHRLCQVLVDDITGLLEQLEEFKLRFAYGEANQVANLILKIWKWWSLARKFALKC